METTTKQSPYQRITDELVKQLNQGVCPWHKAWSPASKGYISHNSGNSYSFLNSILLAVQGKEPGEFLTLKQANAEGGTVKKGATGARVYFYSMIEKETDRTDPVTGEPVIDRFPCLKGYTVFHVADCENITPKHTDTGDAPKNPGAAVMAALRVAGAYSKNGGPAIDTTPRNSAYYSPTSDKVCTPAPAQFETPARFCEVLFHECGHSTGHADRLNRKSLDEYTAKSDERSREELVAEICAAYLCAHVGIAGEMIDQGAAYCAEWLTFLQDNPREFATAAAQAEKAARYILEKAGEQ